MYSFVCGYPVKMRVFSHIHGVTLENTRKYTRVAKVACKLYVLHAHVTRKVEGDLYHIYVASSWKA